MNTALTQRWPIGALLVSLFLYYLALPSLHTAAVMEVVTARQVVLGALIIASGGLIISTRRQARPDRSILAFAAVPFSALLLSVLKADSAGIYVGGFTALVLVALAYADRRSVLTITSRGVVAVVTLSLLLATADDRFAVPGRDFLPGIVSGRAFGLLGHPNGFGIWAALSIGIGLSSRGTFAKVSLVVGVVGLLAAASQTALVAATIAAGLVVTMRFSRRLGNAGSCLVASALVAVTYGGNAMISRFVPASLQPGQFDGGFTGRTDLWATVLSQDVGLIGLSDEQFVLVVQSSSGLGSAHNLWIEIWARSGPIGVIILSLFVLWLIKLAATTRRDLTVFVVVFFLVTSITEGVLLAMPLIVLFSVLASRGGAELFRAPSGPYVENAPSARGYQSSASDRRVKR